jgi:hypothetical protein
MLGMINQDEDMKISFKCSVAHQLLLKFTKSWIVFEQHCPQYDLNMLILLSITKWFLWSPGMTLMDFANSSFDSFFAPSWSEYLLLSFSRSTVLPQVVNLSRSVEKCWFHSCQGFCKLDRYSSYLTIFLFWNQLSYSKDHVYPKSSCWNEIREMSILKSIFGNQACLVKDPTHVIQCSPLIVVYFENRNDPL